MKLQGKIFISTVSAQKAAGLRKFLEPIGATVIDFPMTEITGVECSDEIRNIMTSLPTYQWIIFTSANGVRHFHNLMQTCLGEAKLPASVRMAAVGVKTAQEIEKFFRSADFTGSENTAEDLVNELLLKENLQGIQILLPLGNLAPHTLEERLSSIAKVTRINVYSTIRADQPDLSIVEQIKNDRYDLVLFTSPSGIEHFVGVMGPAMISSLRWASIGPVTTKAAAKYGLNPLITATHSTYEGLAQNIIEYYTLKS